MQPIPQPPFLLPAHSPREMIEAAPEDFKRYAGRKQWEKAFKHIEKVLNSKANGLVLANDGIMLPSRLLAREALMELPPAGKEAYRLFFDPEAKKLLEQAQGKQELAKLTEIVSKFLITGVGDVAADRLADLHFEEGPFSQAIAAWQSILEERPDSKISRLRLRVKLATALARQGRWAEFRDLVELVRQQHATEKLTIGGGERSAVEYLERIAARESAAASRPPARLETERLPPATFLSVTIRSRSGSSECSPLPRGRSLWKKKVQVVGGPIDVGARRANPTWWSRRWPTRRGVTPTSSVMTWGSISNPENCSGAAAAFLTPRRN